MDDIYKIYHNEFGISFQWKKDIENGNTEIIQIVFGKTGFYLTLNEIKIFYNKIKSSKNIKKCNVECNCDNMLLQTPLGKLDLVVTKPELSRIEDLIKGTLFHIELDSYLSDICLN